MQYLIVTVTTGPNFYELSPISFPIFFLFHFAWKLDLGANYVSNIIYEIMKRMSTPKRFKIKSLAFNGPIHSFPVGTWIMGE